MECIKRRNMKKVFTIISLFTTLTICQAQDNNVSGWIKRDTCRVWVAFSGTDVKLDPETCESLDTDFWNIFLKDKEFKHIEEVREALKPFEFQSTVCYLDADSGLLMFCFEKITEETEILWKKEL